MSYEVLPTTLEEAIDILKVLWCKNLNNISKMTEEEFRVNSHFGGGMFLRNSWILWWSENHGQKAWPDEKPKLNEWFNANGIHHADDMSSIILTSFHRSLTNKPLALEEQFKVYIDYWTKYNNFNTNDVSE